MKRAYTNGILLDGTEQAVAQNFAHQRSIVPRLCAGLAVACQMHMQIDQTRHDVAAVQIDERPAAKRWILSS